MHHVVAMGRALDRKQGRPGDSALRTAFAWGRGTEGQLGVRGFDDSPAPVLVDGLKGRHVLQVGAGRGWWMGWKAEKGWEGAWCWGLLVLGLGGREGLGTVWTGRGAGDCLCWGWEGGKGCKKGGLQQETALLLVASLAAHTGVLAVSQAALLRPTFAVLACPAERFRPSLSASHPCLPRMQRQLAFLGMLTLLVCTVWPSHSPCLAPSGGVWRQQHNGGL